MHRLPATLLLPALLLLAACDERFTEAQIAAMEGGAPLPEGATEITFPWFGKQSVMCVGDAVERQIAFVDFTNDEVAESLGTVAIDAQGRGTGSFTVPVTELRTGHADRDEKLRGAPWLDADTHPALAFKATSMVRVRPTVWRVEGTWTMRGTTKPVSFLANVRYVPEMQNVGKDVVRVKASFDVDVREYGVGGQWAGTPAVAAVWQVDIVALGVMKRQ
jgi:polyisoprenoid-binding protein YceI